MAHPTDNSSPPGFYSVTSLPVSFNPFFKTIVHTIHNGNVQTDIILRFPQRRDLEAGLLAKQFPADGIAAGGTVLVSLNKAFRGGYFWMLVDKFGVQWMFNYDENHIQ